MSRAEKTAVVVAIHIATRAGGPMTALSETTAIAGIGLEWDRYALKAGTYSNWPSGAPEFDHALTLIEAEALASLKETYGIDLTDGSHRRNITTRGIGLNALVGRQFRVGLVLCEGLELAHPCAYLEHKLSRPGLVKILAGRGGLRAKVLEGGVIQMGDAVVPSH
jgi:hypothetical protein